MPRSASAGVVTLMVVAVSVAVWWGGCLGGMVARSKAKTLAIVDTPRFPVETAPPGPMWIVYFAAVVAVVLRCWLTKLLGSKWKGVVSDIVRCCRYVRRSRCDCIRNDR
jgi:hypothetical protein